MLDLKINEKWRIRSDKYNFILEEKVLSKKAKKEVWRTEGYYSELEWALETVLNREMRASEATSIQKLIDCIIQTKKELKAVSVVS